MDKDASGMPVKQAAAELGVPTDALRLYMAAHESSGGASDTIPDSQIAKLKEELRSRAGALRLDDLAKTALTIEWLAAAAVEASKVSGEFAESVTKLEERVSKSKGDDVDSKLTPIVGRLETLETQAKDSSSGAVQMVGSLQGMVESQGRELDQVRSEVGNLRSEVATLRSDIASLRVAVHALEAKHHGVVAGLRAALDIEGESTGKARAGAAEAQPTPPAESKKEKSATKSEVAKPDPVPEAEAAPTFVNTPVTTPVKIRLKREIEYNFLLERMGFRRLDSYGEGADAHTIKVPNDDEICAFLCKFELGCDLDEVEIVSVQRGDFQMVQYQRVEKASGIKGWMGRAAAPKSR